MSLRVTQLAHELLAPSLRGGAEVFDATVGWGHDTLWMAKKVGGRGKVWGIDCQAAALAHTKAQLDALQDPPQVRLTAMEHRALPGWTQGPASASLDAAIANLGYLPGEDKRVCTQVEQTQILVTWLLAHLRPGARMVLVVYPGHPEGAAESHWLLHGAHALPGVQGRAWVHQVANRGDRCPWIWSLDKPKRVAKRLPETPSDP